MRTNAAIAAALAATALFGCKSDDPKEPADRDDDREEASSPPTSSGSGLAGLGMMGALLDQPRPPGPYEAPKKSEGFDDDAEHFAVIELGGPVVELGSMSWFGGLTGVEIREIQVRLRELADAEHVVGLLLRVDGLEVEMPVAEELRGSLSAFKSAGGRARTIHCHIESATTMEAYVLSVCDSLAIAPTGMMLVNGVAAMPVHLRGLLDRVGVQADFVHVGAFKGAAEPLTHRKPSAEMLETLNAILDESFATIVAGIAEGRKLEAAAVRDLIDTALFPAEAAKSIGLVDRVEVFERYRDAVVGKSGWNIVKIVDDDEPNMGKLMQMLGIQPVPRPTEPHVALVYAVGPVVDGKGDGMVGARQEIASRPLSNALRVLAADDSVKAIVLRVSSGGGSALASELIWHAVAQVRERKPVIVSMGGVAASGGYYIACGATKIYALSNTLTGSIGVVGGKLAIDGALSKVGVETYPMGRGKRATMFANLGAWSDDERAAMHQMMEIVYKTFVTRVSEGRGTSYDEVHAIAQGRVWTGQDASERGLVDEIGGLDAALAEARKLGGVESDAPLEVYPPDPTLLDFVASMGVSGPVGLDRDVLADVEQVLGPRRVALVRGLVRQVLTFQDAPIQTVFLPLAL